MQQEAHQHKLYVGNLKYEATEEQIKELFSTFGEVQEVRIVRDRLSGQSRGFAFVRFGTQEAASSAKEGLNAQAFLGKTLVIDFARAEQPRESRPGDSRLGDLRPREHRSGDARPRGDRPASGAYQAPRRDGNHSNRGGYKSDDRGGYRGNGDRGGYRGSNDRGNERGNYRGNDRGNNRGNDRGQYRGHDHDEDRFNR